MNVHNDKEYQAAMQRLEFLVNHEPDKLDEITELGHAVDAYENNNGHRPVETDSLIYRIEREMYLRRLKKKDLADLLEITPSRLSEVLHGKREVNMDLAKRLHQKLGIPADFILAHA